MVADEHLFDVFQLIREHVESNRAPLFADQRVDIQRAVTEIPVLAGRTQIVRRGIQHFPHLGYFGIAIPRKVERRRPRDRGRGKGSAVHHAVTPAVQRRIDRAGRHERRVFPVIGVCRQVPAVLFERTDPDHVFIRRGIGKRRRPVVARRRNADDVAVCRKFRRRGKRIRRRIRAERHIHHIHVLFHGIIKPEHEVGRVQKRPVRIAFGFDDQYFRLRRDADHAAAVHGCRNYARYSRTMPLFILDNAPIIRSVFQGIIFDDLVFRRIVRIFADLSRKLGMIGVDAGVDHGNGDAAPLRPAPRLADMHIIQIGLPLIIFVRNGIFRAGRLPLRRFFLFGGRSRIIIQRQLREIRAVRPLGINVVYAHMLRKRERGKFPVAGDAQFCPEFFGKHFRFALRSVIQNDRMLVIRPLILFQLFQSVLLQSVEPYLFGNKQSRKHEAQCEKHAENDQTQPLHLCLFHIHSSVL